MTIYPFYQPNVIYAGRGAVSSVTREVNKVGAKRPLIITTGLKGTKIIERVTSDLKMNNNLEAIVFDKVKPEPSLENLQLAIDTIQAEGCDFVIGLGGGSSLDTAKASAVLVKNGGKVKQYLGVDQIPAPGLPFILIPTTSGTGAEVTRGAVFIDQSEQIKKGFWSDYLLPQAAIVDSDLTLEVPPNVTAASGMDALIHAIESYTAPKANPQTELYALEAIRLIGSNLRHVVCYGNDAETRYWMSLGSLFAGISLTNAGVGSVHALGYPLGGRFNISHGISSSVMLPYAMEFNAISNLDKFASIAKALGVPFKDASLRDLAFMGIQSIKELSLDIGIPQNLRELGIVEEDLEQMSIDVSGLDFLLNNNPRRMTIDDIRQIYQKAL